MNIIENVVAGRWRPDLFCIFDAIRIFRCKINETNEVPQSDCSILLRSPKYLSATDCCLCSATSMLRRKYCSMGIPMLRLQTCGTRNLLYCRLRAGYKQNLWRHKKNRFAGIHRNCYLCDGRKSGTAKLSQIETWPSRVKTRV